MARRRPVDRVEQQPVALVVAQGVGGQAGGVGRLGDAEAGRRRLRRRSWRRWSLFECARSQAEPPTAPAVPRAPGRRRTAHDPGPMDSRRLLPWLVALVVCVAVGAGAPAWSQARVAARYAVTADDLATGRAALAWLAVRGRAPSTGYARERFGQAWADVDRNGCDTRNDVLRRDLVGDGRRRLPGAERHARRPVHGRADRLRPRTRLGGRADRPRRRARGRLADRARRRGPRPSARRSPTTRPTCSPSTVRPTRRRAPATRPPGCRRSRGYRCVYALRQVRVKAAYGLWVTAAERDALDRELGRCVVGTVKPP